MSLLAMNADVQSMTQKSFDDILQYGANKKEKAEIVSKEFESLFVNQMIKEFEKTVDRSSSFLYGGHAEDMYRGMFYQELSKQIAANGGIGLADMIYEQIKEDA